MRTQELIQRLRTESLWADQCTAKIMDLCMEAAEVLECVFGSGEEEINLCVCCAHIQHMDQCKMDVGCSRCSETGCPCQNCRGGSNWELLGSKISDKEGLTAKPDTPLTIEQLRKMRGKWVWIVSPDKDLTVSGWAYVGKDHVFTYWEYEKDTLVGRVVYNICDYGAWLAYVHESKLLPINPLTPEEIKSIDYAEVWISYGESGEWGIVVNGLLYNVDALEGAGFVDMLQDAVQGEDVTRPTGNYKLYRWPPKGVQP